MIEVPQQSSAFGSLTEIRQISIAGDEGIDAVNVLLADGWKLLHIGHTSQHSVYVLSKPTQTVRRHAGFQS